jgi:hypothetical protein
VKSRLAAIALSLSFSACGGGGAFVPTASSPHALAPKRPEAVGIAGAPAPTRNPVEIGRIEASSSAHPPTGDGVEGVLERLRKIAGEHGCDVIVPSATTESLFATSNGTPLYRTHQTAQCFVYP